MLENGALSVRIRLHLKVNYEPVPCPAVFVLGQSHHDSQTKGKYNLSSSKNEEGGHVIFFR